MGVKSSAREQTAPFDAGDATVTDQKAVAKTMPPATTAPSGSAARLVVLEGGQTGRSWTLGATATLGRGRSDVTIEDLLVSREHAVLSRDDAGWMLRDMGSRNGTFVNGRKVDVERVRYGDRIAVGHTVLLLAHVDPAHERLLERQKIEALGRLGAGIAHDLNNYFGAILGAIDFLDQVPADRALSDKDVRECLADVRAATRRGAELTQRLLAFARRGGSEHESIDVSRLCEEAAELARRTFDRSVRVELALAPGLTVRGDRGRLHQVLMNLLVNARDAMPSGGTVRIRADAVSPPPGELAGTRVRVTVEDTGVGMDSATRARIFEPFFTTKAPDRGTGLGLAIALDVVTSHGGSIECDSELGRGTRVRVLLPAAEAVPPRRETRTPHQAILSSAETTGAVLVVDDEPMVRRTIRRLLERAGHRVIEAFDGQRAVDTVEKHGDDIALVLMDLDMPELDGESATRLLKQAYPNLPIVILSGLCDDNRRRRLEAMGTSAVLQKPCDATTLRRAITTALEQRLIR